MCVDIIPGVLSDTLLSFTVLRAWVIVFLWFIFPFATVDPQVTFPEKVGRCLHVWKWVFAYLSFCLSEFLHVWKWVFGYLSFCMCERVLCSPDTWLIFWLILQSKSFSFRTLKAFLYCLLEFSVTEKVMVKNTKPNYWFCYQIKGLAAHCSGIQYWETGVG